MYLQRPFRIQKLALSTTLILLGLTGFALSLNAQCTLTSQGFVITTASCGQANGSVELITTGGNGTINYNWSNGASTAVLDNLSAGLYTVTITDATSCTVVDTVLLQNITGATLTNKSTTPENCQSTDGSISFDLAGAAPFDLAWSGSSSGSQNGVNSNPVNISGLSAGVYDITITDASGCVLVDTITVAKGGGITMTTTITANPSCNSGTNGVIQANATSGALPFEFFINGVSQGAVPASSSTFSNLSAGNYEIMIVDGNGCSSTTVVTLDDIGATPLTTADFTIVNPSCPEALGSLSSVSCPTCELYDVTGALIGNLGGAALNIVAGAYEIRLNSGGCISTYPFEIVAPSNWNLNLNIENPSCIAGNINTLVTGASANYTYSWSNLATSPSLTTVATGSYNLTVTDAASCQLIKNNIVIPSCSSTDTINVNLYAGTTTTTCIDTADLPGTFTTMNDLACAALMNGSTNMNTVDVCVEYAANNNAGLDTICISVCDNNSFCDTTILLYNIVPAPDTAIITVPAQDPVVVIDTCPINLQLSGTLASVTDLNCDQQNEGSINIDATTGCVNYTPPVALQNAGLRSDTVCVRLCDINGFCDTMVYIFNNEAPACGNILPNTPIVQQLTDCSNIRACIPTIPRDSAQSGDYSFIINGISYGGGFDPCNEITRVQYPIILVPNCATDYVVSWTANGVVYGSDTVSSLAGVTSFMNLNDGNTAWTINSNNTIITGTNTNNSTDYEDLVIRCISSGTVSNVGPTVQPQYSLGTELSFSTQGTYNIEVIAPLSCRDTTELIIYCATTDEHQNTVLVGESGTYCLDTTEVPSVDTIFNFCSGASTNSANFVVDQNTACVTYTGDVIGSDLACFLVCSDNGVCDTTYMYIDVALPTPIALNDSLELNFGQTAGTIDVCLNDTFNTQNYTVAVIVQPSKGSINQNDCSITYTVDNGICGLDSFVYIIFNPWGSDTAKVIVDVACEPFTVYDGFSPNGDNVNDFFVIQTIQNFPNNKVAIYNRWGNKVFEQADYQNDWDGTFNGKDLPDDYYYVIVYGNDGAVLAQKWIRIAR